MTVMKRIARSASVLAAGSVGVVLLAPGGLGEALLGVVTDGGSAGLYRDALAAASGAPHWLASVGEHGAAGGLLILATMLAWTGWTGWRRRDAAGAGTVLASVRAAAGTVSVGFGAVVSYLASEAVKLIVDEQRPCRTWDTVSTWAPCPPPGDWSFPSNHATVAGALAAGLIMIAPRLAILAAPLAVLVAGLRVVSGVHYPHDVLAGLLLGAAVTTALLLVARPSSGATAPRRPLERVLDPEQVAR